MVELHRITLLEVVEAFEGNAALVASGNLAHVVLEAAQAGNSAIEQHRATAQHPHGAVAGQLAIVDDDARHLLVLGQAEDRTHRRVAINHILISRVEHSGHCRLDIVNQVVDDIVEANVYMIGISGAAGNGVGADVEADDDCAGS